MRNQSPRETTKIRRSAEQWQAIMAAYEASGLSQEAYCAQASLAMSTFSKWRKQLTNGLADAAASPMFVELTNLTGCEQRSGWDIELTLGDGMHLRLRQS